MGVVNKHHMLSCSGWCSVVEFELFLSPSISRGRAHWCLFSSWGASQSHRTPIPDEPDGSPELASPRPWVELTNPLHTRCFPWWEDQGRRPEGAGPGPQQGQQESLRQLQAWVSVCAVPSGDKTDWHPQSGCRPTEVPRMAVLQMNGVVPCWLQLCFHGRLWIFSIP